MLSILILAGLLVQTNPAFDNPITNYDGSVLGIQSYLESRQPEVSEIELSGLTLRWGVRSGLQYSDDGRRLLKRRVISGGPCFRCIVSQPYTVELAVVDLSTNLTVWKAVANSLTTGFPSAAMHPDGDRVLWSSNGENWLTDLRAIPPETRKLPIRETIHNWFSDSRCLLWDFKRAIWKITTLDGETVEDVDLGSSGIFTVSQDGNRFFYASPYLPNVPTDIRVHDRRTQTDELVAKGPFGRVVSSRDGSVLLFSNPTGDVFVWNRTIAHLPVAEPVTSHAISLDGTKAFCITSQNRVLSFDLDSAGSEPVELVTRTPRISRFSSLAVGSQILIEGAGLAGQTIVAKPGEAWPRELGGVRVEVGGRPIPLGMVSPNKIRAQLPIGEIRSDDAVQIASTSLFRQTFEPTFTAASTDILTLPFFSDGTPVPLESGRYAIYRDTDPKTLLEFDRSWGYGPVRSGERIHLLASGFGTTNPAVPAGQLTPSTPPHPANISVTCAIGSIPVPVEFAGLEPGQIGIYRLTLRLPDTTVGWLACRTERTFVSFPLIGR
jgi:uncharacterized protein (TIGR03437 family)